MKPKKFILGVVGSDSARALGGFVERLNFPNAEFELFHALPSIRLLTGEATSDTYALASLRDAEESQRVAMQRSLEEVALEFCSRGITTRVRVVSGTPNVELLRFAEESKADLIVVGRSERNVMSRYFLGSVSHAVLVGAKSSVLIVGDNAKRHSISAVFATDHSAYCERCVDRLIDFSPRGIAQLNVLNIFPKSNMVRLGWTLPEGAQDIKEILIKELLQKTKQVADQLRSIAPITSAETIVGDPLETVHEKLSGSDAQLLIVGAHGHGWLDRVSAGSFSYHTAVSENCSVLILRVQ